MPHPPPLFYSSALLMSQGPLLLAASALETHLKEKLVGSNVYNSGNAYGFMVIFILK